MANDLYFRRRFEREVRLAAELDHPNVVPLLDSGEREGALFIASQLIAGLNLHEVLTRVRSHRAQPRAWPGRSRRRSMRPMRWPAPSRREAANVMLEGRRRMASRT